MRQVRLAADALACDVDGINEMRDGLPVLTEVRVRYTFRVPDDVRPAIERALARHLEKCPTVASLKGAVLVSWSATFEPVAG